MKVDQIVLEGDTPGQGFALRVIRFGAEGPGPSVYMQAALHAAELPGMVALDWLIPRLEAAERDGRLRGAVTLVPHANPIGLAQGVLGETLGRFDLYGRLNFNRAFPAEGPAELAGRPLPERLKAALVALALEAEVVLDIHCDDEGPVYLYAMEDQVPQALDLARDLGAVAILTDPRTNTETFDQTVPHRWGPEKASRFAATVELRGLVDVDDRLGAADAAGLYRYLVRLGTVSDDFPAATPGPEPLVVGSPLAEYVYSPVGGAVLFEAAVGDWVTAGQRVAQVLSEAGSPRHEVLAPAEGMVMTRRDRRVLRRGDEVLKILRHPRPLS